MFFFVTIALIAAFSLFVLNALIMDYFMEASGPVKAEAGVIGSPTAVPGMDSNQHEKVFYGMALKTLLLFLALFAITVYVFGRWTASRLTTPPDRLRMVSAALHADITMKDYIFEPAMNLPRFRMISMIWLNGSNGWRGKARACREQAANADRHFP